MGVDNLEPSWFRGAGDDGPDEPPAPLVGASSHSSLFMPDGVHVVLIDTNSLVETCCRADDAAGKKESTKGPGATPLDSRGEFEEWSDSRYPGHFHEGKPREQQRSTAKNGRHRQLVDFLCSTASTVLSRGADPVFVFDSGMNHLKRVLKLRSELKSADGAAAGADDAADEDPAPGPALEQSKSAYYRGARGELVELGLLTFSMEVVRFSPRLAILSGFFPGPPMGMDISHASPQAEKALHLGPPQTLPLNMILTRAPRPRRYVFCWRAPWPGSIAIEACAS